MNAVVDASAIVAALVDSGPVGQWAEDILSHGEFHAPEIVRIETMNVLRRLELSKRIGSAEANAARDDLMRLALELHPFEPIAERVWELRHSATCYDACYVALAEALGLPLVTLDRRLARTTRVACRFLVANLS